MKKTSKKKPDHISAIILLPIAAIIIAIPIFLTHLVEAPVSGTGHPADNGISANPGSPDSNSASADSDTPDSDSISADSDTPDFDSVFTDSDTPDSSIAPADPDSPNSDGLPDASHSDGGGSPDSSIPTQGENADGAVQDSQSDLSLPSSQAGIPAPPCTLDEIPAYSGNLSIVIHDNLPFFDTASATESFERYSELDSLGRCGPAYANIGRDLMPNEERGPIGHIRPSGWHTVKYEGIDGNYLYNRCHLIAFQLAGENANERNLITGTRTFNAVGMLSFEETVGNYVRDTGNHVLYRVTPMFRGSNLVADGVLMEAWSVEDNGAGICFNVFVYNVQPGIIIDYATGESYTSAGSNATGGGNSAGNDNSDIGSGSSGDGSQTGENDTTDAPGIADSTPAPAPDTSYDYVLNTNTLKFHYPDCSSVQDMAERNKYFYTGSREAVIAMGYVPCKRCNP